MQDRTTAQGDRRRALSRASATARSLPVCGPASLLLHNTLPRMLLSLHCPQCRARRGSYATGMGDFQFEVHLRLIREGEEARRQQQEEDEKRHRDWVSSQARSSSTTSLETGTTCRW